MTRFLLALFAAALPALATAADLPAKVPQSSPVGPSSGLYFGINGAGSMLVNSFNPNLLVVPGTGNLSPSGGMVGGTIGYGYYGSLYLGLEADFDYDFTKQNTTCFLIMDCQTKSGWFFTERVIIGVPLGQLTATQSRLTHGKFGYVVPATAWAAQVVPFITGGAAQRDIKACIGGIDCGHEWLIGWTVGGGLRLPIAQSADITATYLYVDWNKHFSPIPSLPVVDFHAQKEHLLKLNLNWHL